MNEIKTCTSNAAELYSKSRLNKMRDLINRNHGYLDLHDGKMSKCDAIGITVEGNIFAMFHGVFSMNPLRVRGNDVGETEPILSTSSFGVFSAAGASWEERVEEYNSSLVQVYPHLDELDSLNAMAYRTAVVAFVEL